MLAESNLASSVAVAALLLVTGLIGGFYWCRKNAK
jgi:uncharacterized protein YneF (UPF0154 family)